MKAYSLVLLLAAIPLSAQNLTETFTRMDKASKGFSSMAADIRRTVHTAVVNDDSVESGTIKLKRDKSKNETRILVDFLTPDAKTVSVTGGEVSIYLPKARTAQVYDLREKKSVVEQGLLLGFGVNSIDIKAAYDVTYVGQEPIGGQPTGHIKLVPKSKEVLRSLKSAELWISDAQGVPVQQTLNTSGTGDYTQMQYSNIKLNPPISDKELKLTLPKGVQVQQIGK